MHDNPRFGAWCGFEGADEYAEIGLNVAILQPGQPVCYYHGEDAQEDFLVLRGTCTLLIEGEERQLRAFDLVHCPPWTEHVIVGAGTEPSILVSVGARGGRQRGVRYPFSDLALEYRAGVRDETTSPKKAYAPIPEDETVTCPTNFTLDQPG